MCDCNEVGFIFNEQIGSQRLSFKRIGRSHEMQDVVLVQQLSGRITKTAKTSAGILFMEISVS